MVAITLEFLLLFFFYSFFVAPVSTSAAVHSSKTQPTINLRRFDQFIIYLALINRIIGDVPVNYRSINLLSEKICSLNTSASSFLIHFKLIINIYTVKSKFLSFLLLSRQLLRVGSAFAL